MRSRTSEASGPEPADLPEPTPPSSPPSSPTSPRRPWPQALGFGLLAGALTGFALVGLIAAPLFLWAMATEPGTGLQRPVVRDGLRLAPLLGLIAFLVTAAACAGWRLTHEASERGPE